MLSAKDYDRIWAILAPMTDTESAWWAIRTVLHDAFQEAMDYALHPDTAEDKRAGWAGHARGLHDVLVELDQLKSGAYRDWSHYKRLSAEERQAEGP